MFIASCIRPRLQNSLFFFLKISKDIGKAWRKSLRRKAREPQNVSPQSCSPFSASFHVPRSRVFERFAVYIRPEHVNWVIVKDNLPATSFQGIWNREILETTLICCDHAMCIHELVFRALGDPFRLPNRWRNITYYIQEEKNQLPF